MNIIFLLYRKYFYLFNFRYGNEDKKSDKPEFNLLLQNKYSKNILNMNLVILSNSLNSFIPQQMLCLVYKFFSQFITKHHLVNDLKNYIPQILEQVVQGSVLSNKDLDIFKNVIVYYNEYRSQRHLFITKQMKLMSLI